LVVGVILKLGGAWIAMVGHFLGLLQRAIFLQVTGDSGRPNGVAAVLVFAPTYLRDKQGASQRDLIAMRSARQLPPIVSLALLVTFSVLLVVVLTSDQRQGGSSSKAAPTKSDDSGRLELQASDATPANGHGPSGTPDVVKRESGNASQSVTPSDGRSEVSALPAIFAALKMLAVLSAGAWGVISLVVDYKYTDGRVTPWGKRALVGIVASTLVAISTEWLDARQRSADAKQVQERNHALLLNIQRATEPLRAEYVRVTARIKLPLVAPIYKSYAERLKVATKDFDVFGGPSAMKGTTTIPAGNMPMRITNGWTIQFDQTSPLFPNAETELEAFTLCSAMLLDIHVYKVGSPYVASPPVRDESPDLGFPIRTGTYDNRDTNVPVSDACFMEYDSQRGEAFLCCRMIPMADYSRYSRVANGKITSVLDLSHAKVNVQFDRYVPVVQPVDDKTSKAASLVEETIPSAEIENVDVEVGMRIIGFTAHEMERVERTGQPTYYRGTFPTVEQ